MSREKISGKFIEIARCHFSGVRFVRASDVCCYRDFNPSVRGVLVEDRTALAAMSAPARSSFVLWRSVRNQISRPFPAQIWVVTEHSGSTAYDLRFHFNHVLPSSAMQKVDKLLGPLAPGRVAARTAKDPKHVLVFGADTDQGRSVCKHLIAGGSFVVYGLMHKAKGDVASGKSHTFCLNGWTLS
jgi:hypothetical protein